MLVVKLLDGDLDKSKAFVRIGKVAAAIARANGANNLPDAERKISPRINAAVQLGSLKPLNPENLVPLPKDDYGNGIVPLAELVEWGRAKQEFDFKIVAVQISKAPPPITPLRGSGSLSNVRSPERNNTLPKWAVWKYTPEVEAWQACALALSVDPNKMERHPQNWMLPGADIFLPESFPSDEIASHFATLMQIAKSNRLENIHLKIDLPNFAKWCAPVVHDVTGRDIPPELAALATTAKQATPFSDATPAAKVEAVPVVTVSVDGWEVQARAIADECFDKDTKGNCRDSLARKKGNKIVGGYSFRVMELMQERGIKGPRGIIDNPATIMREALQGEKWWANKSK